MASKQTPHQGLLLGASWHPGLLTCLGSLSLPADGKMTSKLPDLSQMNAALKPLFNLLRVHSLAQRTWTSKQIHGDLADEAE